MDFENSNIDPYEILGVPFGASIEVCKATYRSLTKIYHPDVFVGERAYAEKRMAELNAAFEFLNNPSLKKKFDEAGEQPKQKEKSQEYEPDNDSEEFTKASNALQKNWDFACEFHPELVQLHEDLGKLNSQIAFLFMAVIVEEKLYAKAPELAEHLEDQFLISKFGEDSDLKKIAKYAILNKEKRFAQDLNRALKVLGEGSKEKILQKLVLDYPEAGYHALKYAVLDYLIPNNNPLRQKEFSEAASRSRYQENRKKRAYDGDKEWLERLEKEDKKNGTKTNWAKLIVSDRVGLIILLGLACLIGAAFLKN